MQRVSHIVTGINGWIEDGLAVVDYDEWKANSVT